MSGLCIALHFAVDGRDAAIHGPFTLVHAIGVCAAACAAEPFRADSVTAAAGSVAVTGVLTAAIELPPPQLLLVDGFTLRLTGFGNALGVEVHDDGSEEVVFGMRAAGDSALGCTHAVPTPEPVSALALALVKEGAVRCEYACAKPRDGVLPVGCAASATGGTGALQVEPASGGSADAATAASSAPRDHSCRNLVLGASG